MQFVKAMIGLYEPSYFTWRDELPRHQLPRALARGFWLQLSWALAQELSLLDYNFHDNPDLAARYYDYVSKFHWAKAPKNNTSPDPPAEAGGN